MTHPERSWPIRWQAAQGFTRPAVFPFAPSIAWILAVAAILRLVTLGRQSLWLDEGWTYWVANRSIPDVVAYHTAFDAHPPLYPLLLQPFIALGGSEWLLRVPSAAASLLSVWLVYVIGQLLFDKLTGLLAALIQSVSAFQIWYAQEARMYPALLACVMLATLLALRAQRTGRMLDWAAYGVCQGVALWIDIAAVWFVAGVKVAAVVWPHNSRNWRRFAQFIGAQLLSLLVFSPWLPAFWVQLNAQYVTWIPRATFVGLARTVADFLTSYERPTLEAAVGVAVWLTVVALAASVASFPLYLLLARALRLLGERPRMVLVGAFLAVSGVAYVGNDIPEVKEDYRAAAAVVASARQDEDVVLFDPPYIELPFVYYSDKADHRGDSMQALSVGVLAGPTVSLASAADPEELLAHAGRVWLVTNTDNELRLSANSLAGEAVERGQDIQEWRFTHVKLEELLMAQ
jgi:dolichyl-phosphate-mannose-protein mannosyltransferase